MEKCEQHDDEFVTKQVILLLIESIEQLPDSRSMALRRLHLLEVKLHQNLDQNDGFIDVQKRLCHCREIREFNDAPELKKKNLLPSSTTLKYFYHVSRSIQCLVL